jgi:L-glutamine-phosphate cytidylyltransferase
VKAIITAAGRGSRLGALTRYIPKGLLPVDGESIIARQLRILELYGITDVAIVTGYRSERIVELFKDRVTFFHNPDYSTTTSTASLCKAIDFMDTDMVVMSSDTVFPEKSLRVLLQNQHRYCLLIDHRHCDSEAVKVEVNGSRILKAGKELPVENAFGEWTYISRIKESGLAAYKIVLQECALKKLGRSQIFVGLIHRGYGVYYELMNGEWTEVDFVKDYREAKRISAMERKARDCQ